MIGGPTERAIDILELAQEIRYPGNKNRID